MALRTALLFADAYRAVPGYEDTGAIAISAYLVRDEQDAHALLDGTTWGEMGGLIAPSLITDAGLVLVGTDVLTDGEPDPLFERHMDVIVCAYPHDIPPYAQCNSKAAKNELFDRLQAQYTKALRLFDPRKNLDGGVP